MGGKDSKDVGLIIAARNKTFGLELCQIRMIPGIGHWNKACYGNIYLII